LQEDRFTYISNKKIFIQEKDLEKYKNQIKLISWKDWQNNMRLAVILNEN
jgi:hypothetical protein